MTFSRRQFLVGAAGLSGAAALGLTGCSSTASISTDPRELVLWYWNRSISPTLLGTAAQQIPGSDKRLRADVIGGSFDTKLRTSLAGGSYVPDISAINSNCSLYFPNEDLFHDLNEFGAADRKPDYFEWKWKLGTTPSGRFLFWPMDTGPTGFYYRADLFEKAGVDADPDAVSKSIRTWDEWIELGRELRSGADVAIVQNISTIYKQFLNASEQRYFAPDDTPVFEDDGSTVRQAWDVAVQAAKAGVSGGLSITTDQNAAFVSGKTAGQVEAVWWAQVLAETAPKTTGRWRLASQPVKPGNSGGSFLTVPKTCKDPQAAYDFISWLTTPQHQAESYNEVQLFPSSPASFDADKMSGSAMKGGGDFFGGQDSAAFFAEAAQSVPITYASPYEAQTGAFALELAKIEGGKDPDQAWRDAVDQTNRVLRKRGVLS